MTIHISARLAWHDDGWNGHICRQPERNTFCVGTHSYPGQLIGERRDLAWEKDGDVAGRSCASLDRIPPCCVSCNAFGHSTVPAELAPPTWWDSGETRGWEMPASTICVWPYEQMYRDEVHSKAGDGRIYDYDQRFKHAKEYFEPIEKDRSLVFYYANYSNPFSEDDSKRYPLIGVSRIKKVGDFLYYEGTSDRVRERYAGGFVWQLPITSHYPDQGLRIPYHLYRDRPEILERIALFPDNPRLFKYATRHMTDDDALGLVESFLPTAQILQELGDDSEDWVERVRWLESLIAELWHHRGLLPGSPAVLRVLSLECAIPFFKDQALRGEEKSAWDAILAFLTGLSDDVPGLDIPVNEGKSARRQWRLRVPEEHGLLQEILPRFDLEERQIKAILAERRAENGIYASLEAIAENPYILCEQYVGDDADDMISWGTIDRGLLPSPDVGGERRTDRDDPSRFRALLVDKLKGTSQQTFLSAPDVLHAVNRRLAVLPEWKRHEFHERYLVADHEFLSEALEIHDQEGSTYLYLRTVYEDERLVEGKLGFLLDGPNIELRLPVTERTWFSYLYDPHSPLAGKADAEYRKAIEGQVAACQRVFLRPLSVLEGEAGSGKTTVIKAIIKAIKKGHGKGTSVIALAPTGKAADRIREMLDHDEALRGSVEVATIHSFLAKRRWLNRNMSFKRDGGNVESSYQTFILDECSMLDLELAATFFRGVRWSTVQRLILVGDPNQLPPIGRGKVYADVIDFLKAEAPENTATLKESLRQMLNRVIGRGTGILDLARLYLRSSIQDSKDEDAELAAEEMLKRVQEGGDIDLDLRALYWQDPEGLAEQLLEQIDADMRVDLESSGEDEIPRWKLWGDAFNDRPEYSQILTPYRGELFGTEALNQACQRSVRGGYIESRGDIDGIRLFDKVIQIRNRPRSRPIKAYNPDAKQAEDLEIFNGQLGFVRPHAFDSKKWRGRYFRLKRFQVVFSRRENHWVGFGRGLGRGCRNESVSENLELAYAISVHKAQGSEFDRVYVIIPKEKKALLSPELFYTAVTRAHKHCTLLIQQDMAPLIDMRRPHNSHLLRINSSLFRFRPVPEELLRVHEWYEEGKIHNTLAEVMVRSKSEVIITNILHDREIDFRYEKALYAPDGSFYLPDFTINWRGSEYYWEHLGRLDLPKYRAKWEVKRAWYERFFPGRLVITKESPDLSNAAEALIQEHLR